MAARIFGAFAVEIEMEFHSARAPAMNGAFDHGGIARVIGPTNSNAGDLANGGDRGKIRLFRRRGVGRHAMQHRQIATSGTLQNRHRAFDFGHRRHAGGDDHRLAGFGAGPQQIVPQQLVGRDLVERDMRFEFFDGFKIKWRA